MYQAMFLTGGGGAVLIAGLGDACGNEGDGSGDAGVAEEPGSAPLRKVGSAAQPHASRAGAAASKERRGMGTHESVRVSPIVW
jgi:hypothetical protein